MPASTRAHTNLGVYCYFIPGTPNPYPCPDSGAYCYSNQGTNANPDTGAFDSDSDPSASHSG